MTDVVILFFCLDSVIRICYIVLYSIGGVMYEFMYCDNCGCLNEVCECGQIDFESIDIFREEYDDYNDCDCDMCTGDTFDYGISHVTVNGSPVPSDPDGMFCEFCGRSECVCERVCY